MEFSTRDKNDEKIRHFMKDQSNGKWINGLDFPKDPRSDKLLAPPVTEYINIFIMVKGCEWPCVLSFKRTSTPAGRQFSSDLFMATLVKDGQIPMHSLMFTFGEVKAIDDKGPKTYYHITWKANGLTIQPEVFQKAAELAKLAEAINNITTDEELESEGDVETAPENLKQATPAAQTTINVQAPPVQQQQPTAPAAPVTIPPMPTPTIQAPALVTPLAPAAPAPNVAAATALW
jgi:hypothetical protein